MDPTIDQCKDRLKSFWFWRRIAAIQTLASHFRDDALDLIGTRVEDGNLQVRPGRKAGAPFSREC